MLVIIDGGSGRQVFNNANTIIAASKASEVPPALDAITKALRLGYYVAGWYSYELGYLLEPRLGHLLDHQGTRPLLQFGTYESHNSLAPCSNATAYAGPLNFEWTKCDYANRFQRVRDYIADGDIYQANLSFRARFAVVGDPYSLYERLRQSSSLGQIAMIEDTSSPPPPEPRSPREIRNPTTAIHSDVRRTIRRKELRLIVPLADTTIYELEQRGEFPRRFNLTPRCVVWDLGEVEAWIGDRQRAAAASRKSMPHPDVHLRKSRPVRRRLDDKPI